MMHLTEVCDAGLVLRYGDWNFKDAFDNTAKCIEILPYKKNTFIILLSENSKSAKAFEIIILNDRQY